MTVNTHEIILDTTNLNDIIAKIGSFQLPVIFEMNGSSYILDTDNDRNLFLIGFGACFDICDKFMPACRHKFD